MSLPSDGDRGEPQVYAIGVIINGHVWTGDQWAPVQYPSVPATPARRTRGRWFRPKIVIGAWIVLLSIVLVLGFLPNATAQAMASMAWFFTVLIALPATLVALVLWLAGVGARPQ